MIYKFRTKLINQIAPIYLSNKIRRNREYLHGRNIPSLLSMNCIGGCIYHDCGQKFTSPTINGYFTFPDFVSLCENPRRYLSGDLSFLIGTSPLRADLGGIQFEFTHYQSMSSDEIASKWRDRCSRIDYGNLALIACDRDGFSLEDYERFKLIKLKKVLFTRDGGSDKKLDTHRCPDWSPSVPR